MGNDPTPSPLGWAEASPAVGLFQDGNHTKIKYIHSIYVTN